VTTGLDVTVSKLDQVLAVLFARSPWDDWRALCLESRSGALNKAPRT
jgi:hypothetical protein